MRLAVSITVLAVVFVGVAPAIAKVHRWVDDNGVVHYADRAPLPSSPAESPAPATTEDDATPAPPETPAPLAVPNRAPSTPPDAARGVPRPAPSSSIPTARIVELMERLHIRHDADQIARLARLAVRGESFWSRHATAVWTAVNTAFSSEALLATMGDRLTQTLADSPVLPQIEAWLRSPLGARLVDLGAQAASPAHQAAFRRFTVELPDTVSVDRIGLVRELGRVSDSVSVSVNAATSVQRAVNELAQLAQTGVRPRRDRQRGWSTDDMRWHARMSLLFSVRELSDDEVRTAIAFWTGVPGRTLSRACRDAVLGAIETAQERAAERLRSNTTSARR